MNDYRKICKERLIVKSGVRKGVCKSDLAEGQMWRRNTNENFMRAIIAEVGKSIVGYGFAPRYSFVKPRNVEAQEAGLKSHFLFSWRIVDLSQYDDCQLVVGKRYMRKETGRRCCILAFDEYSVAIGWQYQENIIDALYRDEFFDQLIEFDDKDKDWCKNWGKYADVEVIKGQEWEMNYTNQRFLVRMVEKGSGNVVVHATNAFETVPPIPSIKIPINELREFAILVPSKP